MLNWFDKHGPFVDDDRLPEPDDYFECMTKDVTDTGLGESARRVKAIEKATSFSFSGGEVNFGRTPLKVIHGLAEAPLGQYDVDNIWTLNDLQASAVAAIPNPTNWRELIEYARALYPHLKLADTLYQNPKLAAEPFDPVIRERAVALLSYLDLYMQGRNADGSDGPLARDIIDKFFAVEKALFTPESETNRNKFSKELTFEDPDDRSKAIFGDWHGKIKHRQFRLHFEWPVPAGAKVLKILYFGPKITKD